MKKTTFKTMIIGIVTILAFSSGAFADNVVNNPSAQKNAPFYRESHKTSTWLRLCLWPHIAWPSMKEIPNTHGVSLGIATYGAPDGVTVGADLGFVSLTKDVRGAQLGFYTQGELTEGAQGGFVNIGEEVNGAQVGLYNQVKKMDHGPQLAIVNYAKHSDSFQIGLINIMDNGFLPVFPIINFPVD